MGLVGKCTNLGGVPKEVGVGMCVYTLLRSEGIRRPIRLPAAVAFRTTEWLALREMAYGADNGIGGCEIILGEGGAINGTLR